MKKNLNTAVVDNFLSAQFPSKRNFNFEYNLLKAKVANAYTKILRIFANGFIIYICTTTTQISEPSLFLHHHTL